MAVTTATVLAGLSAASTIAGGISANNAAQEQANIAEAAGITQAKENVRTSAAQAKQEADAAESAQRQQKLAYLKSGVSLEGSPLLMMEDTRLRGERNVDEIMSSGAASSAAALAEGRAQASSYESSGRSALISGLGSATKTVGGQF